MRNGAGGLPVQRVKWHRALDAIDLFVAAFREGMASAYRRNTR